MELQQTGIWIACCAILLIGLLAVFKSGHPVKAMLFSCGSGLAALFAVHLLKTLCGVGLPVNEVTLSVAAVGGVPGVILLLISGLILG